jgi:hypothetical protein
MQFRKHRFICFLDYRAMEEVQKPSNSVCTHFFINMVLGRFLPAIQPQAVLEWKRTRFEDSLAEFYTIIQVALQMWEVGNCSSL